MSASNSAVTDRRVAPTADREGDPRAAPPRATTERIGRASAAVFVSTFAGMFLYELLKTASFPTLSIWESHTVTIVFSSVIATLGAVWVLRAQSRLHARLLEQTTARERIAAETVVLASSEARFRALVEQSPEAVVLHRQWTLLYANPAAVQLLGGTVGTPLPWPTLDAYVHPDDRLRATRHFRALARGAPLEGASTYRLVALDRSERVVELTSAAVLHEGAPATQTIVRDLTIRLAAEHALQESERRFRSVTEYATDAIISADAAQRIVFWNAAAERLFGYAEAEAMGQPMSIVVPPAMRAAHDADFARAVAGGEGGLIGRTVEGDGVRRDGSTFPIELSRSTWQAGGRPFVTSFLRDVSARKAAESALHEHHALLTAVMEGTTDALWVKNVDGTYRMINGPGARMLGRTVEDVIGRTEQDLFDAASAPVVRTRDLRVIESGATRTEETESTAGADGQPRAYVTTRAPLRDGDGRVVGVIGVSRDITERKAAERALARSHALLEATLEGTADAILVVDGKGRVARFNEKLKTLWQIPDAIAADATLDELIDIAASRVSDPVAFVARAHQLTNDVEAVVDDVLAFADGRVIEQHSQPQRMVKPDGQTVVAGRVFSFRDVTAHVRAGEALRESEQRLRLALDSVSMVVWERTLDSNTVTFHVAPDLTVGGAPAPTVGPASATAPDAARGFIATVHPDDRDAVQHASRAARDSNGAFDIEYRVLAADGDVEWRHTTGRVFAAEAGRPARMVGVDLDVSARKRQEEAARERDARLRLMAAQLPAVLWSVDTALHFTSSTGAALAALGLRPDEVVGVALAEFFGRDDHDFVPMVAARQALAGHSAEFEQEWAGQIFSTHVEPLRDADGRVTGVVGLSLDVTERKRLEQRLVHQAFHDPLTGLANRALFRDRVEHALARCTAARDGHGECVAVLFLDLDDFKSINDTLGHGEGDRVLTAVAERLLKATRGYDTVARLGGDEFAVLLEGMVTQADADLVVTRVIGMLDLPLSLSGSASRIRASIGLAHATGGETADDLLRNADVAMYEAKAAGKGRHAVFAPDMHRVIVARLELEADLRFAVDALDEFRLVYQPVVELTSGRLIAFEALLRWHHPVRGEVSPVTFIPLAEAIGLIATLGRWALRETCRQLAEWSATTSERDLAVRVGVNVSGRQLEDGSLVDDVTAALADFDVPPDRLTLEVTETAVMRDTERSLATLHALKALGVRIAVDDFGTGYSSLSYLQLFPVDVLKIDKAFVDGVAHGGSDAALARTIIALGQSLGLRTVAEGVEREEQREALIELGCTLAQGYLFARPLEVDAATAALLEGASLLSAR